MESIKIDSNYRIDIISLINHIFICQDKKTFNTYVSNASNINITGSLLKQCRIQLQKELIKYLNTKNFTDYKAQRTIEIIEKLENPETFEKPTFDSKKIPKRGEIDIEADGYDKIIYVLNEENNLLKYNFT